MLRDRGAARRLPATAPCSLPTRSARRLLSPVTIANGKGQVPTEAEVTSRQQVAVLRGPGVNVDRRRLEMIVVALVLVALGVSSAVLFAVGAHQNSQIDQLRSQGVPIEAKVSSCLGLLGGSGSNGAGFSCTVSYVADGHHYKEAIPGNSLRNPGSTVRIVVASGDPTLLATPGGLANEHASWRVFILPAVLLMLLVAGIALVLLRRSRASADRE